MRRMILLSAVVLLVVSAAEAQRRGGMVMGTSGHFGMGRIAGSNHSNGYANNHISNQARGMRYGLGYGYGGYGYSGDVTYDEGGLPGYAQQPMIPAAAIVEPSPPEVHPVVTNYTWPAAGAAEPAAGAAAPQESVSEPQSFGIVLRDGRTISAVTVAAAGTGLQYVDAEERHLRIAISEVDRAATLKLNRERKLMLYLPATQ